MKFRYADELKAKYEVKGHFYNLIDGGTTYSCRSVLEIKRRRSKLVGEFPDVVLVMMNPGSSKPADPNYEFESFASAQEFKRVSKKLVLTQPDSTQYQVMRLMLLSDWRYARIINLSDLRNGNSTEFQKILKEISDKVPHSLLHADRADELSSAMTVQNDMVIGAWGSIPELQDTARMFLDLYPGIIMMESGPWPNCRHASPMMKKHKIAWLRDMRCCVRRYNVSVDDR